MLRRSLRTAATSALMAAVLAWSAAAVPFTTAASAARPGLAAAPAPLADPVRVMPLGDSITGSPGCWRALLWNRLQSAGHTNVDFVGTLGPQGCGQPYDGDNEGHGGYLVTNVANQNLLPGWLSATRPDIVLMHFGTNDVWSNIAPATILAAYSRLVDQMRASNPAMRVLVAKIIPMAPTSCPECGQRVVALNDAIDGWAAGKTTAQSPIVVVDQWTGFRTAADTYDGVHPNAAGDQKMSDRWYPALVAALTGVPTTPTP
ncbi:SGNH/GDSL hydrolase family protein, partial [Micromonospora endophytica]